MERENLSQIPLLDSIHEEGEPSAQNPVEDKDAQQEKQLENKEDSSPEDPTLQRVVENVDVQVHDQAEGSGAVRKQVRIVEAETHNKPVKSTSQSNIVNIDEIEVCNSPSPVEPQVQQEVEENENIQVVNIFLESQEMEQLPRSRIGRYLYRYGHTSWFIKAVLCLATLGLSVGGLLLTPCILHIIYSRFKSSKDNGTDPSETNKNI